LNFFLEIILYFIVQPCIGDNECGDVNAIDDESLKSGTARAGGGDWGVTPSCFRKLRWSFLRFYDFGENFSPIFSISGETPL
jgi:hypothetical protein